jgi:hypothetical protein
LPIISLVEHVLACEVAAFLRADLVFELDRVGAGALQRAHRVAHIERIAEARIGIDDERQVHGVANPRRVFGDLVQAHEAEIGQAERHVRHARAGDVERLETRIGDHARAQRVEGARHEQGAALLDRGAKGGAAVGCGL